MDLAGYVALTRASGLAKELQSVANNIANLSTTGYRREGVIFAEEVRALPLEGGSVAMTAARARYTDKLQGSLEETGGSLDLAIEGDGYFTVMTPQGERLTRAGAFTRNADGMIVNMDGHPLLDEGGGEITIPFEAKAIAVASDGTLSVDGAARGQDRPRRRRGRDEAFARGGRPLQGRGRRHRAGRERPHRPGLRSSSRTSTRSPRWRGWSRCSAPTSTARS